MEMLICLILVVISQYIHISKHQVEYLKYIYNYYVSIIPQESWKKILKSLLLVFLVIITIKGFFF